MKRLDFRMPDFNRTQWAPGAREVWEPRFSIVSDLWSTIEIRLVAEGFKPSALLVVTPERLSTMSVLVSSYGLSFIVLGQQGRGSHSYASTTTSYVEGQPFDYRVVVCKPTTIGLWIDAWAARDDDRIGALLGYPECCRQFFVKHWALQSFIDTTWLQAYNTVSPEPDNVITVEPDPACNVTLRTLGIRWVSHLPCSFKCSETVKRVESYSRLMKAMFPDVHQTLTESLQWPVRWTALHGIAEIVTPVCRIVARTDATPVKYTVNQTGTIYPEEGARSNTFPFRNEPARHIQLLKKPIWILNGFSNMEAMTKAHNVVVQAAGSMAGKTVIDLGCGTGELLRIYEGLASELHGVDTNPEALEYARKVANVRLLNIFDPAVFDRDFDVAFISVERLEEHSEKLTSDFLTRMMQHIKETVFYSYAPSYGWSWILGGQSLIKSDVSAIKVDW